MTTTDLHVFCYDDTRWVIATDGTEARRLLHAHEGGDLEDFEQAFRLCDDRAALTIWCDSDGNPCDPSDDDANEFTRTMREWADLRGAGFLCTTEI